MRDILEQLAEEELRQLHHRVHVALKQVGQLLAVPVNGASEFCSLVELQVEKISTQDDFGCDIFETNGAVVYAGYMDERIVEAC